ncbi:TPA_asm: hypothetical protein GNB21_003997 [Salmonella enterica subsp. indica serovar 41:b:1,7]|nr:hypothetical protein [Salmonella enterica subsp. indica serovar 41:b:1,7]
MKRGHFSANYSRVASLANSVHRQRLTAHAAEGALGDRLNYWDVKMSIQYDFMLR